jgi:hypothetical protein
LFERAGLRTIGDTVAAAGAFSFDHFVHVVDILHLWMDRTFRTDLAAEAAGDTKAFDDSDFHNGVHS